MISLFHKHLHLYNAIVVTEWIPKLERPRPVDFESACDGSTSRLQWKSSHAFQDARQAAPERDRLAKLYLTCGLEGGKMGIRGTLQLLPREQKTLMKGWVLQLDSAAFLGMVTSVMRLA